MVNHTESPPPEITVPLRELEQLAAENAELRRRYERANQYIRDKINQLLEVMGTSPLRAEELDDKSLIDLDPIGIVGNSFRQILGHLHQTNEKLKYAHEEIQAIFDAAGFGILVIDRNLRILAHNTKMREKFFPPDANPLGRFCHEMICGLEEPVRACPFRHIFESGASYHRPGWVLGGRHYDVVGSPVRNEQGEVTSIVMVYADITERIVAEESLRRSEERYRDLFENAHDLILSVRLDGTIEYVNRAWSETLGYRPEEAATLSLFGILHPDCREECRTKIDSLLREGKGCHMHTLFRTKNGNKVVVDGNVSIIRDEGKPVGLRGILRDITEKERLEEEFIKREKLESVGLLAGGIAHDFNNILTAIMGNINLATVHVRPGDEIYTHLIEAEKATLSARELTQQLLTFAKGGLPVKKILFLGEAIRDQTAFALRGSSAGCQFDIAPDLWAAEVDEGQIGQVVNNLVLNAAQAMPHGGKVRVSAQNVFIGPQDLPPATAGKYIRIRVEDEGCGIPKENLQRMFDPYFTTKAGGTGLGLAITYSIVKKHDGQIRVESEVNKGSTFEIYLPAYDTAAPAVAAAPQHLSTGKGRILVLDDEEVVRHVATQMLQELGYEVECVDDGAAVLACYQQAQAAGRGFDAVIMDLTIPGGMGGQEALAALRAVDPLVKAIVSSGYSNDPVMARFRDYGFCNVIAKPYRLSELGKAVREALQEG